MTIDLLFGGGVGSDRAGSDFDAGGRTPDRGPVRRRHRSSRGGDVPLELQQAAKSAGVFAPHAPVFEEAGYSLFGPTALSVPARMTHVMRWLGAARRGHDIAATRALLRTACWDLDQGQSGADSTSIAKTYGSEAVFRVVDRSIQMCGGLGVSDDLPLARLPREVRPFRVYDGPSEVRRWAIAMRAVGTAKRAARKAEQ